MTDPSNERIHATTATAASPHEVFAFLCVPANHQRTEPTDWVRDEITSEPITAKGQIFGVHMYLEQAGGHYDMHNLVTEFEPGLTIAWLPGTLGEDGIHQPGGWWWRYDIEPDANDAGNTGSRVTLTYDWSDVPTVVREQLGGMPPFPPEYLAKSLAELRTALDS